MISIMPYFKKSKKYIEFLKEANTNGSVYKRGTFTKLEKHH